MLTLFRWHYCRVATSLQLCFDAGAKPQGEIFLLSKGARGQSFRTASVHLESRRLHCMMELRPMLEDYLWQLGRATTAASLNVS